MSDEYCCLGVAANTFLATDSRLPLRIRLRNRRDAARQRVALAIAPWLAWSVDPDA